jgi:WD40 repeat protein
MRPPTNVSQSLPTAMETWRGLFWSTAALTLVVLADGAALAVAGKDWGYSALFLPAGNATVYDVALGANGDVGISLSSASDGGPRDAIQRYVGFHRFDAAGAPVRRPWDVGSFPASAAAIAGGTRVAIGCYDGSIYIVEGTMPAAPPVLFARHEGRDLQAVLCSADGRCLLSLGCDRMFCWDVASRQLLWNRHDLAFSAAAFDPKARWIVVAASDGSVYDLDASTGDTIRLVASMGVGAAKIALSRDGRRLAVATFGRSLSVWDRHTGTQLWSCVHPQSQLCFSPDGRLLCSYAYDGRRCALALRDPSTGRLVTMLPGHTERIFGTTFFPDGTLCSWGGDGMIRLWNPALGQEIRTESLVPSFALW